MSGHRGPDPEDAALFAPAELTRLSAAARDYEWLLGRDYSAAAALKLVGDHFQLRQRQRMALQRAVCSPAQAGARRARRVAAAGHAVVVDGFNVLVTLEVALSGGVVVRGPDGLLRDVAGLHGSYRAVTETRTALAMLANVLADAAEVLWLFDRPVSNSGRVAAIVRETFANVELVDSADAAAVASGMAVATSDGPVLDRATANVDLAGPIVSGLPGAWLVDVS